MKPPTNFLSCENKIKDLFIVLVMLGCTIIAEAQTYTLGAAGATNGSTVTTCAGTFYDPGGAGGNYSSNSNLTITFCSGTGGPITFDFGSNFNTEATNDFLQIYDGPNTTSRLLYTISGDHSLTGPAPVNSKVGQIASTGTCLTFRFVSNVSTNRVGWAATIGCTPPETNASGCLGGLAAINIFLEDFERGAVAPTNPNVGAALPGGITGYTYHLPIIDTTNTNYMVNDGEYAIVKNPIYAGSRPSPSAWANFKDHTNGNGYMMVVNADYNPDTVYSKNVTGLLPNTVYFATAWVRSASSSGSITFCTGTTPAFGNIINANIDFKIYNSSNVLQAINSTGNIQPVNPDPIGWKQYNTYYQTGPAENSFLFQIVNRASGGCGNDFILDDIQVRECPSNIVLLPVQMASFTARPINDSYVSLEWRTNNESNSDYFVVERSKEGVKWEEVSRMKAAGNSTILRTYNEVDRKPLEEVSYYRLKQVDINGKVTTLSDIKKVQLKKGPATSFVSAGPNPFTNEIKVFIKGALNEKITVTLSDPMGIKIRSEFYASSTEVNTISLKQLAKYAKGVYVIQVQYADRIEHLKLLKR